VLWIKPSELSKTKLGKLLMLLSPTQFTNSIADGVAVQKIGFRTIRPYTMNAIRTPSTPLKKMGVISRYLTCTQANTILSIVRTAAATTVSTECQWRAAGTISPTVQTSSRTPRAFQCRTPLSSDPETGKQMEDAPAPTRPRRSRRQTGQVVVGRTHLKNHC
jgi:hypothetical protein